MVRRASLIIADVRLTQNKTPMNLIKRSTFALTMALAVILPIASHAAESMAPKPYQSCIQACQECVTACESCATACLKEPDVKAMATCIQLCRDCADVCSLSAQLMARDSAHADQVCSVCAKICQACADECAKHKMDHCQKCSEACQKCADECKKMAK
jgi:hypothetical protein